MLENYKRNSHVYNEASKELHNQMDLTINTPLMTAGPLSGTEIPQVQLTKEKDGVKEKKKQICLVSA